MNRNFVISLFSGLLFIVLFIFVSSFMLALLMKYTSINESNYSWVTLTLSFIALFLGGIFAGVKNKENGWMIGLLTGFTFSIGIFLIQFLGFDKGFTYEQIIVHIGFILLSLLGGILGVNMFTTKNLKK